MKKTLDTWLAEHNFHTAGDFGKLEGDLKDLWAKEGDLHSKVSQIVQTLRPALEFEGTLDMEMLMNEHAPEI